MYVGNSLSHMEIARESAFFSNFYINTSSHGRFDKPHLVFFSGTCQICRPIILVRQRHSTLNRTLTSFVSQDKGLKEKSGFPPNSFLYAHAPSEENFVHFVKSINLV